MTGHGPGRVRVFIARLATPGRFGVVGLCGLLLIPACVSLEAVDPLGLMTSRESATDARYVFNPEVMLNDEPYEASQALMGYFSRIGHQGLADATRDPNLTIALHAAWELALGPAGNKREPLRPQDFFGFLTARTGLTIPLCWEYSIRSERVGKEPPECRWPSRDKLEEKDAGIRVPAGTSVSQKDGRVTFWVGDAAVTAKESDLAKDGLANRQCLVVIGAERSFISLFEGSDFDLGCDLIGFETQSGRRLWHRRTWGTNYCVTVAGLISPSCRILVPMDGGIAIFGEHCGHAYAEAFDAQTGAPIFRLSNDYWCRMDDDRLSRWRRRLWR